MNISNIILKSYRPALYEPGSRFMWTDNHISKQLLFIHLNPDVDLASRKVDTIQSTAAWILGQFPSSESLDILDLGCGPGLYTEIYARQGHNVTGIDISKNSIAYAKKESANKKLNIKYLHGDYNELELPESSFDLITMIYTDFGVLPPEDRKKLLVKVHRLLKPGGRFIFDVLNDNNLKSKTTPRVWDISKSGFWKNVPYIVLSDSHLYEQEKVILYQHIVVDENEQVDIYRFWTHFFSEKDLKELLRKNGFKEMQFQNNVLPDGDEWSGDNVIFCIASKAANL